jgi:hypothetical protein
MDSVQKNAVTDYNAPSSETFRLHLNIVTVLMTLEFSKKNHSV